jgi:Fur family ferric uptake transcriptional regulator
MERSTRQKAAIRAAIEAAQRPLTPQEVLDVARLDVPALSIATVYRNLKSLLAEGAVEAVALPGESPRYESTHAAETHHHHFQCTRCQRVFDVPGCAGELERLAPPGFQVDRHEVTLYGLCADCGAPVTAGKVRRGGSGAARKPARGAAGEEPDKTAHREPTAHRHTHRHAHRDD